MGKLSIPLTIGQISRRENFHVVNAPLPFGILSINSLHKFRLTIDFNKCTIFQLGTPLSTPSYHFNNVPNVCTYWQCQAMSQRPHHTTKSSAYDNHCVHSLKDTSLPTCPFFTKANCPFYMPSNNQVTTTSTCKHAQKAPTQRDNSHTKHIGDHTPSHNYHMTKPHNELDTPIDTQQNSLPHAYYNKTSNTHYTPQFTTLLQRYTHIFTQNKFNVPCLRIPPVKIPTNSDKIITIRPYRVPLCDQQEIRHQIQQMLENGIIEQSFSPFFSPVTLVTKRDKTKRFCIDYRKVNELISSDVHPLPRIEDILDRLAQAKYVQNDILLSCKIASDQLENYDKVIECFESHFIPRRNIIYERARFNQRCQQEGEKVNEFITALHSLAEHCNFEMLHDELIRDRIVVGVRDRALSERMQLDTDLTLVKATLMAKQLESVKEQQSSLYQQDSVDQIKKMPNHIKETKRHEPKIRQFKSNQLGGSSHGCTRCGNSNNHNWKNCPAMNSYCNKCMKKGHYAKVCRSEAINEIKSEIAFLGSVEDNSKKWIVPIKVNNRQVNFKIDTGADVNVLPLQYYYQSFQRIKLEKSDKILQSPNGIPLETVGMIHVKLQNKGQHLNSKIYIVDKLKQPLLSGETRHAKINYKISLQPDAKPYALCTPRRVPIPLMKQVKEQLEEMTRLGVIESVEEPTEWCAGMVAVSKPGGKIRICVDLTKLNQYIRRENYPLPATEHILGQLGNACYFSKLDANSGFWQFGLAKESQKLTTFITPFGRFFFKRIPFGITSAPEIFQRKMTQLLGNIEGVVCFMDDIVVYGSSLEEHNERVRQVLKKIQEEGMTLNPEKCQFGVKTVKFLGHTLSSEGLFIDEEKLDAITKMEAPRSTKELKSFLGMVNYLGKFIPNLADKLQPLNSLLSTKNEWVWDEPQKKSFNLLKQELVSRPNLALFDPSRTTIVSADASSFGIGGVLRQEQPNGSLKPIAYVSRTLSETKKRYSQIEKEGLAIVWTCERLKDYVTGIKIHIETDHKPLIAIFTSKSLEDMTPRLQRLKMRMMRYSYQISHIAGKKQIVADMLSRKPMSKPHKDELEEELSAEQKEDSLCSQLAKYCMSGWPKNKREVDPELRGYWQFQEDLTYQNGLLLRGQRILIPKTLRKDILEKLHQGHFGINKCRSRAKESVWWLGISQEIERMVSSCTKCLKERKPKHEPLMPSEFPIRPWQKVGMDLFYLNGRWYLIVCDYYSRYPEISLLQNLTAQEVIGRLKSIFARHGTPETVRSDNGPQFQKVLGSEFSKFSKEWSFKHITSSPKFPQSNGFIEAIIKNIKQSFKKEEDCYLTLQAYRTMPLESGYSPAELLMGRRLRTSVPAIESSLMPRYLDSEALQEREKRRVINQKRLYDKRHDVHSLPPLQQGDSVWVRDQRVEGKVLHKSEEPRSYWVQTPQGKVRRNRLHLTPLPKMGSTMDASEDDQEQETEEDCPTPTASSTRDGRMQRDNQDQDPEKSLPSMPAVHTRYGRAVKIPRSPQIYERAISQVLQRHGLDCVAHYFDDFIIYSNTLEEHQNHLRQFFAFCEAEKLQLNFVKCEFFKQSIDFLGYTITAGTITPLTRNTDIIHAIKQPHNRKTLQSFLGAVNVYNKFIPEYARLRAPLNNLLKKDVVWNWNEVCQEAFIDLKGNLTQHPILHLYKEGLPCQVYCDASTLGIAGILKQVHPDGNVYPVQYFSRTLRPHEKNYSISELECLAIVESVEKFRIYLMGRKFTIFSDHHALQWLKTIKNPSGRLFRWSLRLSSYEYEVRYIKGKLQYEADLLSRNPFCGFLDTTLIKTHQPPPSKESSLAIDHNGLHTVSRKGVTKIILPKPLIQQLLQTVHTQYNHPGISQMSRLISTQYYWQGMSKDIKQKVKTCPTCQLTKRPVGPTYGELSQPPEAKKPFDLLSLDTIAGFAKYGNTKIYLHVVVDHFSRYAWTFPSKSTSIITYQQVLKRVLQDGSPKRLLTDRAPAFTSPKFRSFLLNRNIHPLLTTSNNPQANGLCERLNATLTGKLRLLHLENPKIAWTKLVKRVTIIYNKTPHSTTGFPPIYLMFGILPPELSDQSTPYPDIDKARKIAHTRTQNKHLQDKNIYDQRHK
ncbi:K02A2.6-like [Cordylochernes scorpioides]|uniref:RNA-directed DNA polymerase n=1 Tax=Cordylochernes scorpioides TaxID=51811 RepID=A0ABY6K359_9ARAC|nr:K02A2.6-like [Cordylochernes scorpioides]